MLFIKSINEKPHIENIKPIIIISIPYFSKKLFTHLLTYYFLF